MKRTEAILAAASLWVAVSVSAPEPAAAGSTDNLELGINTGVRRDSLDWNIAGRSPLTSEPVSVISELTWDDIEIYQLGLSGRLVTGNSTAGYFPIVKGYFNYGWITDGAGRDSDYSGNNRTLEFSRSISSIKDDNVLDASIGAGFQRRYRQNRFAAALLVGYSYHEQNLRLTDGVQVVSEESLVSSEFRLPPPGPFPGLDSTYETRWRGPWLGIDVEVRPSPVLSLLGSAEYHWVDYRAEADWNLRFDFAHPVSFRHDAGNAHGLVFTLAGRYLFTGNWTFDLALGYQRWQASNGVDRTFFADGRTVDTRLNEVNWESLSATGGISYVF